MTGIANFEELYQVTSNRLANSISELSQLYKKELEWEYYGKTKKIYYRRINRNYPFVY